MNKESKGSVISIDSPLVGEVDKKSLKIIRFSGDKVKPEQVFYDPKDVDVDIAVLTRKFYNDLEFDHTPDFISQDMISFDYSCSGNMYNLVAFVTNAEHIQSFTFSEFLIVLKKFINDEKYRANFKKDFGGSCFVVNTSDHEYSVIKIFYDEELDEFNPDKAGGWKVCLEDMTSHFYDFIVHNVVTKKKLPQLDLATNQTKN